MESEHSASSSPERSLDRGDLFRHPHVADIEDPDPAETRVADGLRNPLKTAVEPAPCLLDGHDQKIPDDGQIALASRTHDRAEKLRLQRILDVVRIESVKITFEQKISGKSNIRVREVQNS